MKPARPTALRVLLSLQYTSITHDDDRGSTRSLSTHSLTHIHEERTRWRMDIPAQKYRHRRASPPHCPGSRMAASPHALTPDVLSNHGQLAISLRTPHYTTAVPSPHAKSHTVVPLERYARTGHALPCAYELLLRPHATLHNRLFPIVSLTSVIGQHVPSEANQVQCTQVVKMKSTAGTPASWMKALCCTLS
jgi:hypothetical protein